MKCATIGCESAATRVVTYTMPGQRGERSMESVCDPCAGSYERRPSLQAEAFRAHVPAPDAENMPYDSCDACGTPIRDHGDGVWRTMVGYSPECSGSRY